jgi:Uma2 family endonuclease
VSTRVQSNSALQKPNAFPLLETGYHLSADEFHERYKLLPDEQHAELIEGIVYMASPVSRLHSLPHATITGLCMVYAARTPGLESSANGTIRLDADNEYEPDGYLRVINSGRTNIFDRHYLEGGPEFVFEISNTTVTMDLHEKFKVYERKGVQEYLVWQVQEQRIDLFSAIDNAFRGIETDVDGILKSKTLPGLWFDTRAIVNGDNAKALATLETGLKSEAHAHLVERLRGGAK